MPDAFDIPILFLVFNRPDLTALVWERIRSIRPGRFFVAADGPRAGVPGDGPAVDEVRRITRDIDWPCSVERLERAANLGCMEAVAGGITWFFEHVERGIIIEDDCLPDPCFFPYCRTLLERFEGHPQVMHIGGTNPLPPYLRPTSYYFSKYNRIWGWATWRRAWQHFDATVSFWPSIKASGAHRRYFSNERERQLWEGRWDAIHAGARDTWDHQWFLCRLLRGVGVVPMANLVSNLGFRPDAVHTTDPSSVLARRPCYPLPAELNHPEAIVIDDELDDRFYREFTHDQASSAGGGGSPAERPGSRVPPARGA